MADLWVISDTHFGHARSLEFETNGVKMRQGFKDVDHMNEVMIERWNAAVKPQDKVYHLGDVFFGSKDKFEAVWRRLNGKKRLIVGNHDDIKYLGGTDSHGDRFFQKIDLWRVFGEWNIIMSHIPLHRTSLLRGKTDDDQPALGVHGHIHDKRTPEPSFMHCVCVEQTDYRPVNIDTLRSKAAKLSSGTIAHSKRI